MFVSVFLEQEDRSGLVCWAFNTCVQVSSVIQFFKNLNNSPSKLEHICHSHGSCFFSNLSHFYFWTKMYGNVKLLIICKVIDLLDIKLSWYEGNPSHCSNICCHLPWEFIVQDKKMKEQDLSVEIFSRVLCSVYNDTIFISLFLVKHLQHQRKPQSCHLFEVHEQIDLQSVTLQKAAFPC